MNRQTLKALKGSIKKWELIVRGESVDKGIRNCPLCELFWKKDCKGCPVSDKTGDVYCNGSPYSRWEKCSDLLRNAEALNWECAVGGSKSRRIAKAELKFLKSLLP
jgi:hypothetical protein